MIEIKLDELLAAHEAEKLGNQMSNDAQIEPFKDLKFVFYVSDRKTGEKLIDWQQIVMQIDDQSQAADECKAAGVMVEKFLQNLLGVPSGAPKA